VCLFCGSGGSATFSLFEADGVTPVDILSAPNGIPGIPINLSAPEPGSSVIGLAGVIVLLTLKIRRRKAIANPSHYLGGATVQNSVHNLVAQ
jgi:hypothetical protein